ncbi:MAG: transglutaminase-like domain-containing protein [Gemmataceae bacterium]|nr:transglutaminase-like domain-containing protein [Gemmataceae bacterium]
MDLDATLDRLAADPHGPVDLADLALHLARDEYPDLDIPAYLGRLDALAAHLRPRLTGALAPDAVELTHFLFREQSFAGNEADYYDPRNSYLNDVLDRKLGIPITLAVVAVAVGGRAGLTVAGVGLPGHFVAKVVGPGDAAVLFDPFHGGQLLDPGGCEALVSAVTGQPFAATPDALAATPPGYVAVRMLNNLKAVYLNRKDFARAARVMGRLVRLVPGDPEQERDLGVALVHAGQPGRAIDHLRAYLDRVRDAADELAVRDFLTDAMRDVARWN